MKEPRLLLNIKVEASDFFIQLAELLTSLVNGGSRMAPSTEEAVSTQKTTGTRCSICMEPQFETPSGVCCKNGHGGASPFGANTTGTGDHLTAAASGTEQAPPPPETDTVSNGVELADGIPWDERIHSSNKKKYSKPPYKWMRKRGLSDALEAEVEAELRALMAAPAGGTPEQPPETSAEQAFGTETTAAGTEQAPPPPPPPETEAKTDAPEITNFVQLVQALAANKIDHAVTDPIIAKYGVQSLPLLGSRPDLIPSVVADLRALGLL